jgi:hypothetical protein
MQRGHLFTRPVTQQNRQAIGHLRGTGQSALAGLRTIGLQAIGRVGARCNDVKAMDLV